MFKNDPNVELVATVTSGQEALTAVSELRPDLVLQMPGMNGLDAARELSRRFPEIPVIVVTAHEMPNLGGRVKAAVHVTSQPKAA